MGNLSDDTLKLNIDINGSKARSELGKMEQSTRELKDINKDLRIELQKLEAAGKKNSEEYKRIQNQMKANNVAIQQNEARMAGLRKEIGLNGLTSRELRKEMLRLKQAMDTTTPGTPAWKQYRDELGAVTRRMNEVRGGAQRTGQAMGILRTMLPIASVAAAIGMIKNLTVELFNLSKIVEADSIRSQQVFGNSLGYVSKAAEELGRKMGLTTREFVAAATATGDLLIPLDFSRQKAAEMSVELQGLAGALDEWTGGQIGATGVSQILTKAMLGETEGLKQLGIAVRKDSDEFRDLVKEKEKTTNATKAQVEAMVMLELIQRKSADAQAAYGMEANKLLRLQKSLSVGWKNMKENIVGYFAVSQSEKMEEQRSRVNALTGALYEHNLEGEQRKKIIKELQTLAPEIVASLDAEGKATDLTRKALEKYNEVTIHKIFLKSKEEDLMKEFNRVAKQEQSTYNIETELRRRISDMITKNVQGRAEELIVIRESGMAIREQALAIQELGLNLGNVADIPIVRALDYSTTRASNLKDIIASLQKEMQDASKWFEGRYGLEEDDDTSGGGGTNAPGKKPKELKPMNTTAFEREYERSMAEMDKALDKLLNDFTTKWGNFRDIQVRYGIEQEKTTHETTLALLKQYYDERLITDQQYEEARQAISDAMVLEDRERALREEEYREEMRQLGLEVDEFNFEAQLELEEERFEAKMALEKERFSIEQTRFKDNKTELLRIELEHKKKVRQLEEENLSNKERIVKKEMDLELARLQVAQGVLGGIATALGEESKAAKAALIVKQGVAMAEATIAMALGMAKTASVGFPQNVPLILGFIAQTAGFIGAIRNAVKGGSGSSSGSKGGGSGRGGMVGRKDGGYTPRTSSDDEVTGWHHGNEFFVNAKGVRNPSVKMVTDVIDAAQKNGTIDTIDLPRIIASMRGGRKEGGYSEGTDRTLPTASMPVPPELMQIIRENTDVMRDIKDNGVSGVWDFDYDRRSRKKMEAIQNDVGT